MAPNSVLVHQFVSILYLALYSCSCNFGITSGSKNITVYCVISTNSSDNACESYNFTEKNTLYHYMRYDSKYFKSYQNYVFEVGSHTPHHHFELLIHNVTNLTLTGLSKVQLSKKSIIDCNQTGAKFTFIDTSNIIISDLFFKSCVQIQHNKTKVYPHGLTTIVFINGANISMLRVSVLNCADQAFFIQNTVGSVIIDSMEVANCSANKNIKYANCGNAINYNHHCSRAETNILIKNSRFLHNVIFFRNVNLYSASGLKVTIKYPNVKVKLHNVTMSGNIGGNLAIVIYPELYLYCNSSVEITNSMFEGGTSLKGAGMTVTVIVDYKDRNISCKDILLQSEPLYVYNSSFINNVAGNYGSGVYLKYLESLLECKAMILVTFEHVHFMTNSVDCVKDNGCGGGIAFHCFSKMATNYLYHGNPQIKVIINKSVFLNNTIKQYDPGTGVVFAKLTHYFHLNNTSILHNTATGIIGMSSNIILSQNVTILHNTGYNGGGMLLCQKAVIYLKAYTNVTIAHNHAKHTGGGICVETDFLESLPICFFQLGKKPLIDEQLINTTTVNVHDNSAHYAGNNIFGGSISFCYLIQLPHKKGKSNYNDFIFRAVFKVPNNTIQYSSISSLPRRICLCQKMTPNCNTSLPFQLHKFPGETFSIDVVIVGQFNGTVPGTVQASLKSPHSSLKQGEYVQNVSSTNCNQLNYTIYTGHDYQVLYLRVQHAGDISGFEESFKSNIFSINVTMIHCPFGFNRMKYSSCECCMLLNRHSDFVNCDISTQTVKRSPPSWIGFIEKGNGSNSVAFHTYCPFDYCLNSNVDLSATNNSLSQDAQCALNRTGVLCGSCSKGLSVVLGTTKCHHCSNYWLLLLILFALSGIGVLIALILFDITIAEGTLSGIIFYFNIIGSNLPVFFPSQTGNVFNISTSVLKLVISLINLETGISMCLFNGMDSYIKAWLEFCFPIYLWILTGGFIFFAGSRCSWIVRRNAVKVLATFILLSYTRLLTAIAGALQVTKVQLEGQEYQLRWLADGNTKYFRGKHIPLAIFSVMFGCLLLPFALCLLFIQCLQKVSEKTVFSWVDHLKPFFDVYTGPFTSSGRFWTGLLLLSRCILLIITAVNVTGDPCVSLGAIIITIVLLLLIAGLLPAGLYRRRYLNALEYSSLVNLGILSSLLFIFTHPTVISHVFVSIEIFLFIGVIVHRFTELKVIQKYSCCKRLLAFQIFAGLFCKNEIANRVEDDNDDAYNNLARFPYNVPEDREPLLATEN